MNAQQQIRYWAHMLDEAFNKEQFLCEDKEGKKMKNYPLGIKDESVIKCEGSLNESKATYL